MADFENDSDGTSEKTQVTPGNGLALITLFYDCTNVNPRTIICGYVGYVADTILGIPQSNSYYWSIVLGNLLVSSIYSSSKKHDLLSIYHVSRRILHVFTRIKTNAVVIKLASPDHVDTDSSDLNHPCIRSVRHTCNKFAFKPPN